MRDFSTGAKRLVEKQLAQRLLAGGTTGGSAVKTPISELVLGDIRIVNGTVRYTDERDGSNAQVGAINASFDLASLSQPLGAKGSFVWSKKKIGFDGTLTSPQQLLDERPAKPEQRPQPRQLRVQENRVRFSPRTPLHGRRDDRSVCIRGHRIEP